MSTESVMPSNQLILCCPLLLLLSIFPRIRVFSSESALHIRWPKYWTSASASVHSMNIQGWFPLGFTCLVFLQSRNSQESSPAPQFKSINSSVLFSAFFMVQLSHLYMTSGKIIALTRRTFVSKAMSLLFNTLSRFVIAFLPKSKCLLLTNISW